MDGKLIYAYWCTDIAELNYERNSISINYNNIYTKMPSDFTKKI